MQNEIKNTLTEVRKAYRLLYEYQTRILSLIKYIGETRYNFEYKGGWPAFSKSSPNNAQGDLERSAWDWLNFYFYQFHFERKEKKKETQERVEIDKEIKFSIFLVSDTGAFEYFREKQEKRDEKNKEDFIIELTPEKSRSVSAFKPLDISETKLIFVISKEKDWNNPKYLFGEWNELKYKSNFLLDKKGNFEDGNDKMFFKPYNLEDFETKEKADEKLEDFYNECREKGIFIKDEENKDSENKSNF